MERSKTKEEIYQRDRGEEIFLEVQDLCRSALMSYHKDWEKAVSELKLAVEKVKRVQDHFEKAGLESLKLNKMTAGGRRIKARDVLESDLYEALEFLNEPKLPDVVVYDFLDRSAPVKQLEFRILSEVDKANKRAEGESKVSLARKCIQQGMKDQEAGMFASAKLNFDRAQTSMKEAKQLFISVNQPPEELMSRWNECCADSERFPMLTTEKQRELEQALIDREKEMFWSPRDWELGFGIDHPTLFCVGMLEVGIDLQELCSEMKESGMGWPHSEEGILHDGSDCMNMIETLEGELQDALRFQEEDMAFKAEKDRSRSEESAVSYLDRPMEQRELLIPVWEDLPPDKLGEVAATDEVKELHECAFRGDVERLVWLLEVCEKQHFLDYDEKKKPVQVTVNKRLQVDVPDYDGKTALFQCARANQSGAAKVLLEHGARIDHRDVNGNSSLHIAAASGSSEVVKLLLEEKASPLLSNLLGELSLVAAGADLNVSDHAGQTALRHAIKNRRLGSKELYMINFLLVMGADADARDGSGRTALDLCDHLQARSLLRRAYSSQGQLR
ncbi:hypothetical protein GUITHDRAFT_120975 [Guillardia theta CCMP2712]|uniref:Uncharacterized protein n=1 Tax=Guillardia theta (strain CCMP2712) TaxID=905079 RepID=L1IAH6_GUITC|nr:hypothetical protein GUITHDRAFT_120975 [Guillardia theta CCMP2712]EKX32825.1 hypothetical protein GUITHDRAFT_120975 [Guillardia theta CCMP2712]|eukprot:XP_005819805.1 hypothetical protein GUITHDRAFT_120975 [Guillardia theta CCMP2712]